MLLLVLLPLMVQGSLYYMTVYNSTTCAASTKNVFGGPFIFDLVSSTSNCLTICADAGCFGHKIRPNSATKLFLDVYASVACSGTPFPEQTPTISPSSNPTLTCNPAAGVPVSSYLVALSSSFSASWHLLVFLIALWWIFEWIQAIMNLHNATCEAAHRYISCPSCVQVVQQLHKVAVFLRRMCRAPSLTGMWHFIWSFFAEKCKSIFGFAQAQ